MGETARGPARDWRAEAVAMLSDFANGENGDSGAVAHLSEEGRLALQALKIDGLASDDRADVPLYRGYDRIAAIQQASTAEVVRALVAAGASPLLFKGIDLLPRHFASRTPSVMGDIDLLVERSALGRARAALFGMGLRQANFDRDSGELIDADIADIADIERSHYELHPFRRLLPLDLDPEAVAALRASNAKMPLAYDGDGRAWLIDEIDLHHGVALDVDAEPLFAKARASLIPGARALDPADHLWLLTSRYYHEVALHGKRSLRDFAYIIAILRDEQPDWDRILAVAAEYEMRPSLFYYLRFADSLFERPRIDGDIWRALDPRQGSRARDWGWLLAPLFEWIDPMPDLPRHARAIGDG